MWPAIGMNTNRHRAHPQEAHPTFENIPPELRSQILYSVGDLRTLKSLVHASPTYHEQYRLDRDRLLHNCLKSELDGFYVDALATLRSLPRHLGSKRYNESIAIYLDTYNSWLLAPDSPANIPSVDSTDISWLCAFHSSVVLPLADMFCKWAFANLKSLALSSAEETAHGGPEPKAEATDLSALTESERTRILRALYRCETYHNLFGENDGTRIFWFRRSEITDIYFHIFEPWEAEEVACIDSFMRSKYTDVFNKIKADLHPLSSRFDGQRGGGDFLDPDGSHELDDWWGEYIDGTTSLGIRMAAEIFAIDEHDKLLDKTAVCITRYLTSDPPIEETLSTTAQYDRQEEDNKYSAKDAAEGIEPLPFSGDTAPPRGPPLAWTLLWGETYVNIYGGYVPQTLQASGWVMWDGDRLDSMGARELITDQWGTEPDLVGEIARHRRRLAGLVPVGEFSD